MPGGKYRFKTPEIMQTILGAGGAIGTELASELKKYTPKVRLVSRNPARVNPSDELFPADLTQAEAVDRAVAGSEVVYLVAGLDYKLKVWEEKWPVIMQNVINACKKHRAKLVFFDNIYMYDPAHLGNLTEETPIKPSSKKGAVRARIAAMVLDEVRAGKLTALIARAPDFIGPKNSLPIETVFQNLKKGKKAMWFGAADKVHSFIFTHDAAKATARLGNTPDAFNQVWHLPTSTEKLTGKDWIGLFAKAMQTEPKFSVLPAWLVYVLGWFMPIMKEFWEMRYQFDRDYFFDSSKFARRFHLKPVSPAAGVKWVVETMEKQTA